MYRYLFHLFLSEGGTLDSFLLYTAVYCTEPQYGTTNRISIYINWCNAGTMGHAIEANFEEQIGKAKFKNLKICQFFSCVRVEF